MPLVFQISLTPHDFCFCFAVRARNRRIYEGFQHFFKAYLRLWSILVYLGIYQSASTNPSPFLPAMTSCPPSCPPRRLTMQRHFRITGQRARGRAKSVVTMSRLRATDQCCGAVCVCVWRWLNSWKETVHQCEIWKQFDCIKAFKASPLISLLASRQCHTHPPLCAAARSAQTAFHNYTFTRPLASSFTHLFIHLFICYRLCFDPAVIYFITDEMWPLFACAATCPRAVGMLCIQVAGLQEGVLTGLLIPVIFPPSNLLIFVRSSDDI